MITKLAINRISFAAPDKQILDGVSFEVLAGLTLLTGANGSGKSTLLKIIAGQLKPSSGSLRFMFSSGTQTAIPPKEDIGVDINTPIFYPQLSVRDALLFHMSHFPRQQDVDALLRRFQLAEFTEKYSEELSTGQKQRLSLARTVSTEPSLLLLDEPESGLDKENQGIFQQLLKDFVSASKLVIIATHTSNSYEEFNPDTYNMDTKELHQNAQ